MSIEKNVIWRRGDETMPEHANCIVEAAKDELLLKSLRLSSEVVDMIRYNANMNAQSVNDYISAILVGYVTKAS